MYSTNAPPAPVVPDVELGGLSFMATTGPNKASQSDMSHLLAGNGSSDHYFDDTIIPWQENLIINVETL